MKRSTLFITAMSALALASCADSDEPISSLSEESPAAEGITFRSGMASRATETTNANLTDFYVTAFTGTTPYFSNEEFSKGSDSFFTSPKKFEWLDKNETIDFMAYSPSQDLLGADITQVDGQADLKLENFAVADQIADQVDFITAKASGTRDQNENTGVELTFDHRLSQIEVRAKSENTAYDFKVTGVRIGRAEYIGTFDFASQEWTLDDWHDTAVYTSSCDTITLGADPQSIMGPSGNAMLMPQKLTPWSPKDDPDNVARDSYLSVLVRITRKDNGFRVYPYPDDTQKDASGKLREYAWASIPLSGTWEQGKKYIYTLDFTYGAGNNDPDDPNPGLQVLPGDIKFTVQVNNWIDTPSSIPMTPVTTSTWK